jgi:Tfp pilus assembly protein PilN
MMTINILPEKLKNDAKLMILGKFIKKITNLMIFFSILVCLILFAANYLLQSHYDKTISQSDTAGKNSENYSNKVREINNLVNFIKKIQENEIDWTETITGISRLVGSDVSIERLNIDRTTNTIIISGIANSRDNLLTFKNNLEKTQNFDVIKLPIKTMLEQNDVQFEISTTIKNYAFN